jgi:hypothetical protein
MTCIPAQSRPAPENPGSALVAACLTRAENDALQILAVNVIDAKIRAREKVALELSNCLLLEGSLCR